MNYFLLPFYFFSITTLNCCSKFTFPHLQIKHMAALQTLLMLTMSKQVQLFFINISGWSIKTNWQDNIITDRKDMIPWAILWIHNDDHGKLAQCQHKMSSPADKSWCCEFLLYSHAFSCKPCGSNLLINKEHVRTKKVNMITLNIKLFYVME